MSDNINTNANETKRKKAGNGSSSFWIALVILIILLICSIIVLSFRLHEYVKIDDRVVALKSNMDAELDIFSVSYANAEGVITVEGLDGDKVVAPGTDVDYTIRLKNQDSIAIDYMLMPSSEFLSEHSIPIFVRLLDPDDNYILGDAKSWSKVDELNGVSHSGTLARGESVEYLFQWQWPFESGNDAYDTSLGDISVDELVGIEVALTVHTMANTDIDANGGFFDSGLGDDMMWLLLFILLLITIILLILYKLFMNMASVSLDAIAAAFESGAEVTLETLKEKELISKNIVKVRIKAKKNAVLDKALNIEAHSATKRAEELVRGANGRIITKKSKKEAQD